MLHCLPRVGAETPVFPSPLSILSVLLIVLRELVLSLNELVPIGGVVLLLVIKLRSLVPFMVCPLVLRAPLISLVIISILVVLLILIELIVSVVIEELGVLILLIVRKCLSFFWALAGNFLELSVLIRLRLRRLFHAFLNSLARNDFSKVFILKFVLKLEHVLC